MQLKYHEGEAEGVLCCQIWGRVPSQEVWSRIWDVREVREALPCGKYKESTAGEAFRAIHPEN